MNTQNVNQPNKESNASAHCLFMVYLTMHPASQITHNRIKQ